MQRNKIEQLQKMTPWFTSFSTTPGQNSRHGLILKLRILNFRLKKCWLLHNLFFKTHILFRRGQVACIRYTCNAQRVSVKTVENPANEQAIKMQYTPSYYRYMMFKRH